MTILLCPECGDRREVDLKEYIKDVEDIARKQLKEGSLSEEILNKIIEHNDYDKLKKEENTLGYLTCLCNDCAVSLRNLKILERALTVENQIGIAG